VDEPTAAWLLEHPGELVTIDLDSTSVTLPTGKVSQFPIEAFARYCLMNGTDELGYLLSQKRTISAYEQRLRA